MKILSIFLVFYGLSSYGAERTYYDILEVSKTAGQEEIKKAYRKLIFKHHPNRQPGGRFASTADSENFIKLTEAYKVLNDPLKRKQYDCQIAWDSLISAFRL